LQQVGGVAEVGQRVLKALSLDPNATLFSVAANPPPVDPDPPPTPPPLIPRRRPQSRQASVARRFALAAFMGLSGALAFSLLTDGGRQTRAVASFLPDMEEVLYWTGLGIDQVGLSGQRFTADADVFGAIEPAGGGSLLTFDAAKARARIEELPWVETASISRVYPGALEVRITERQPSAVWRNEGRDYLIDSSGRVLSALKPGVKVRLPRIAGAGAPQEAQALLELIVRFPRIAERFEMAERVGGRRWTLHLKDNVVVHLGAEREAVAFAALSAPDELGRLIAGQNVIIDLRARGRFTVRRAPSGKSETARAS
jgi:cell division protein FtsQ